MRIQEVIRQTGLSRRTIYYYIDQKLITPRAEEANGYHDFSEKDIQKLFLVRKLREAGLPLADIRAILKKPRTTPFYLHKQLNVLRAASCLPVSGAAGRHASGNTVSAG